MTPSNNRPSQAKVPPPQYVDPIQQIPIDIFRVYPLNPLPSLVKVLLHLYDPRLQQNSMAYDQTTERRSLLQQKLNCCKVAFPCRKYQWGANTIVDDFKIGTFLQKKFEPLPCDLRVSQCAMG
jgi:hypothetical protein